MIQIDTFNFSEWKFLKKLIVFVYYESISVAIFFYMFFSHILSAGRIAGLNIAGKATDVHSVPYFWTVQYGKSIRYTGYGPGYDDVVVHGDMDEGKFLAYYTK